MDNERTILIFDKIVVATVIISTTLMSFNMPKTAYVCYTVATIFSFYIFHKRKLPGMFWLQFYLLLMNAIGMYNYWDYK